MFSLYIHVPFCNKKCSYCNFFIAPLENFDNGSNYIDNYYSALLNDIDNWADQLKDKEVKTLYFGGGTPLTLGKDRIINIINKIKDKFDLSFLEELSFELNPDPVDETLDFVDTINNEFKDFFRLRFSFGIQSFDNDVLKFANRSYNYTNLVYFLRQLPKYKEINTVFNFDFIAFGKFKTNKKGDQVLENDGTKRLWDPMNTEFFDSFVNSGFADSFSLYTLELFPGSPWNDQLKVGNELKGIDEDEIYEEFDLLNNKIVDAGYKRYEISNYSSSGKSSIHNRVYWEGGNYIGLGMGASSYLKDIFIIENNLVEKFNLKQDGEQLIMNSITDEKEEQEVEIKALRFDSTKNWKQYFEGDNKDEKSWVGITDIDMQVEKIFVGLRTDQGVENFSEYEEVLVENVMDKIDEFEDKGLLVYEDENDFLYLTDEGFDLYNYIITELVEEF